MGKTWLAHCGLALGIMHYTAQTATQPLGSAIQTLLAPFDIFLVPLLLGIQSKTVHHVLVFSAPPTPTHTTQAAQPPPSTTQPTLSPLRPSCRGPIQGAEPGSVTSNLGPYRWARV